MICTSGEVWSLLLCMLAGDKLNNVNIGFTERVLQESSFASFYDS